MRKESTTFSERKKKINGLPFVFSVVVLFAFGCEEPMQVDRKKLSADYIQRKLDDFESLRNASCVKEAYRIATKEVDSLLIARAKMNRNRDDKPVIPPKPPKPNIMQPLDSSSVKPIFE